MSVQHANRGIVKKDLQLYYNREFVKSFRGEATINTCDLNTRVNYVWANAVATRDTTAPVAPPITGFEIAKLRSTDGQDAQTILYTAAVDQVNGGVYTHSAYIYLESGTWVSVGQHWNPWDYGVQTYIPLNKWTRVSYTVTNSAANYGQVACSYNTNGVVYITATQYERKSYSTPFVASTLWTPNLVNVISTNGNTTMTKNTVGNGWTTARVYSTEGYNAPCYVSFKASQTTAAVMIALNSDPATGINYTNLDYAFYLDGGGYTAIYESGANPVTFGSSTYATSTLFEIIYDGTNINYYMDGVLKRTVARSGSGPLYLDSSFWSNSAAINSLSFGPLSGTNRFSNTIAGGGGLLDMSGNNVNVSLSNVAFDSGGYYFTTAGSNYINTGITTLPSNTQLTIDVWTKPTSTTQAKTLVSKWGSSSQSNFCFLLFLNWFAQGNIYFLVGDSAGTNYSLHSIPHNLSTSVYINYTIVYDNGYVSWYRNGVFIQTDTNGSPLLKSVTTAITIGADYDGGNPDTLTRNYDGIIPNVRLYSRPLTAAEVLQNFNATRKTYGL